MSADQFTALAVTLLADGYQARASSPHVDRIDRNARRRATCCHCLDLEYRPFGRPGRYRAISLRPECGNASEF